MLQYRHPIGSHAYSNMDTRKLTFRSSCQPKLERIGAYVHCSVRLIRHKASAVHCTQGKFQL